MSNVNHLLANIRIVFVDVEDLATTGRAVFEVTPEGGMVELPRGRRGEQGEKGAPADPVKMRAAVLTPDELPRDLGPRDENSCFPVLSDRSLRVWTGDMWLTYPNWTGAQGPAGVTPSIQIGRVEEGITPQVNLDPAGSPEHPILNFVLPEGKPGPRGLEGPVGPANSISTAIDFDTDQTPLPGDSLVWSGDKWAPTPVTAPVGPWTLAASQFKEANVGLLQFGGVTTVALGELTVPPLPFPWKPMVEGNVEVETSAGVWVDIEVRMGSVSGQLVGISTGQPLQRLHDFARIYPYFEQQATPGNGVGRVEANTSATFFVVARRTSGIAGSWRTKNFRNHLTVMAQPVLPAFA